jgi:hypothetical protein
MYGGKRIARGDTIFIFASEHEGGRGLIAIDVVVSAKPIPKKRGIVRETPRVTIHVRRTKLAKRGLGRNELKRFSNWTDEKPETELNFKFYRRLPTRSRASPTTRRHFCAGSSNGILAHEQGCYWRVTG